MPGPTFFKSDGEREFKHEDVNNFFRLGMRQPSAYAEIDFGEITALETIFAKQDGELQLGILQTAT